jgi:hypothetical protein
MPAKRKESFSMSKSIPEFPVPEKPALLRSAHIFFKKNSQVVVVVRSWQAIRHDATGVRVLFAGARFQRAQEKPTPASLSEKLFREAA